MRRYAANPAIVAFHEIERGMESRRAVSPVARMGVVLAFLITLVSFGKYELAETVAMAVYPFSLACFEGVRIQDGVRRFWYALLPVALVGAANPYFDRSVVAVIGGISVTGGWLSFSVLLIKGLLALSVCWSVLRLVGAEGVARTFAAIHLPKQFGFVFLLMHRYLVMMVKEAERMRDAYLLRSGRHRAALHPSAWGPFAGLLLMRSMDRAARVQEAVELRGGASRYSPPPVGGSFAGWLYFCGWIAYFAFARLGDPMRRIGEFVRSCAG